MTLVEEKTKALTTVNVITSDLNKEIKEFVKMAKKSKDKVKDIKNAITF